jgi:large subunit ribosomal protein L33
MAKAKKSLIRLVSSEGSGTFFVRSKNPKGNMAQKKLSFKKFDKKLRRHVVFNEAKIK